MAHPRDDLTAQVEFGRFSPDYRAERWNKGAADILAQQNAATMPSARAPKRKIPADEASYTRPGTPPFTCGNCRYYAGPACMLVAGPYDEGTVNPEDTCRFFLPRAAPYGQHPPADTSEIAGADGGSDSD